MFTIIAFVALIAGAWATMETAGEVITGFRQPWRKRADKFADILIFAACVCVVVTALHSLASIWL